MCTFLQNCLRDYDNDIKLQTDEMAWRLINQQVKIKTVASSQECVGELANLAQEKVRKRGQSSKCVLRISESLEMPEKGEVSGKMLRMDTQELVNDHGWAPRLSVSQDA